MLESYLVICRKSETSPIKKPFHALVNPCKYGFYTYKNFNVGGCEDVQALIDCLVDLGIDWDGEVMKGGELTKTI